MSILFRTEINLQDFKVPKTEGHSFAFMGSCFATEMQQLMAQGGLKASFCPFGVIFNPVSLSQTLKAEPFWEDGFCQREGKWFNFHSSSRLNAETKKALELQLKTLQAGWLETIANAQTLVITLGTAWVYKHIESDRIVANCQKIPQKAFQKDLLTIIELVSSLKEILKAIPSDTEVVFTISPVRHLKDGFVENNLSKALLRVAVNEVINLYPNRCFYFPAFELMMDDLRDYRFYKDDLLHPSTAAISYIFYKFSNWYLTPTAKDFWQKNVNQLKRLAHIPIVE